MMKDLIFIVIFAKLIIRFLFICLGIMVLITVWYGIKIVVEKFQRPTQPEPPKRRRPF